MTRSPFALLLASSALAAASFAQGQWLPRGELAKVLVVDDCHQTAGDAMASRLDPPTVYVCPGVVRLARRTNPGVEHFFFAHEFGHIALQTADEALADCWAARVLAGAPNGGRIIAAAVALFGQRAGDDGSRYGTPAGRAERISRCALPAEADVQR